MGIRTDCKGFTLIEIKIAVGIIAILMAIAIPNLVKARETSRQRACLSNLCEINMTKEQYAMECRKNDGDGVGWGDIVPNYLKTEPTCPIGPRYELQNIGTYPSCPNPDHAVRH